jgi:ferric-dicitrate binding protein FerR (iron transport regulator)
MSPRARENEASFDPVDEVVLTPLSEAARRVASAEAGPGPTPAVWHRLQARREQLAGPVRGPVRFNRWLVASAVAAAAIAVIAIPRLLHRPRPLTYEVAQAEAGAGADAPGDQARDGYIRGVGDEGTNVRFSDGTKVALQRGARLSVLSRNSEGARLRVEDGEAHFEVVHREKTAWSVEAGPFVVYVTGTKFDVRWSGSEETVEVRLREGAVKVGGPLLPERVTLRPGQRLVAHLASGELHIDEVRAPVAATDTATETAQVPAPAVEPAAAVVPEVAAPAVVPEVAAPLAARAVAVAPAAPQADETARPTSTGGTGRLTLPHRVRTRTAFSADARGGSFAPVGWAAQVAAGDSAGVVAEAETHGIERTLAEIDGPAMAALADAARYRGRRDIAVRVLLAERSRFPGTAPAQVAAFLLGRLADDRNEAPAALEWYRRYLSEAPRGPYAAEALGREMLTVERLHGRASAQDLAAEYVRRFPNGTYLLQAHSILANP